MAQPPVMQDDAGNLWFVDAQGKPTGLAKAAGQGGGPNVVIPSAPAKPELVPGHPNIAYHPDSGTTTPVPGIPAPAAPAPNFVPGKPGYTVTGSPDHPQAVPIAGLPGAGVDSDATQRAKAIQQYTYSKQLDEVANHLTTLYQRGPGSTHGLHGLMDLLPTQDNANFDTAANAARGIVGQSLGFTGGQLNTEREAKQAVGPYLPQSSNFDSTILQKIQTMRQLANDSRQNAILTLGGEPDANGVIHPVAPSNASSTPTPPGSADQVSFAAGKTRDVIDPALRATGIRVGAMLSQGVPDAKIIDFLQKSGVDPKDTSIQQALQFRSSDDFKKWQRDPRNAGRPYPIGSSFYTKQVPMTGLRQTVNQAAASDIGGSAIAAGAGATNSLMGDRLGSAVGALTGEPATAQTAMQMLATQHPAADLAGNIAGQAALEGMAGGIPGLGPLIASRWGRRAADAGYGAYYGSGDNSGGDAGVGGLEGAATNMLGGMFGRGVQKGVGRTLSGVKNSSLQYLDNLGVPLTIGQIGHGSENTLGHIVGGLEDRFAGLPGFDAVIGGARKRGESGFNSAAFKEAGGSGATGGAGLDELNGLRNNAYSFLNNIDLPLDARFAGTNAGVRASIPDMPAFGNEVGKSLNLIDKASANGALPGRDWQSAISDIRGNRSSIAGAPFARQAVGGMKDIEGNLLNLADRQGPAGTLDNLNGANRLNSQVETLSSALDNGPTQKADQLFTPGRLDDASRVNSRKFGGRMASLTGQNRPFYGLTQAGNEVMPSAVKDSGTAGRMWLVPLATSALGGSVGAAGSEDRMGGGELGAEYGGLLGLAAMGPYSKAGQKIIQKALLGDRSARTVQIGDYLINQARIGGMFGAGAARQYGFQPGLPQ